MDTLLVAIPALLASTALVATSPRLPVARAWRLAVVAGWAVLALAAAAAALAVLPATGPGAGEAGLVDIDAAGALMLLLVSFLGGVILRFSRTYLAGEPNQRRYVAAMLATLAGVSVIVIADNLFLLVAAWLMASLSLHRLLTFYGDRPHAVTAAHKKFIAGRLAEICLLAAAVLVFDATGSASISGLAGWLAVHPVGFEVQLAAVLLALGVILKSAQMPVHGWLLQVMEAPTPVSALLHAGIVNLGGFVLIKLAALISAVPAAQALLVTVGSVTVVLASLVMLTRISVKVRLAWSTCAQMGFMLVECGLGLYELALLHLLGHSLYKAHAFLSAGSAVTQTRLRRLAPATRWGAADLAWAALAAPLAVAAVWGSVALWALAAPALHLPAAWIVVLGLTWAPLLWRSGTSGIGGVLRGAISGLVFVQVYLALHLAAGLAVSPTPGSLWLFAWTAACFVLLYAVQVLLLGVGDAAWMVGLRRWAYAGLYLDEWFTRMTFRLWPARLPATGGGTASKPVFALMQGRTS
jgi:NAD(P)H-quinone oxidoreductase subunit 5